LYSLKKLGLTENNPKSISSFIGTPLHLYFETVHNLEGTFMDNAIRYYREYYSVKGQFESVLYEGIFELLESLCQKKNLFLVTSKPKVYAESILDFFNIRKFFNAVYGSDLLNYNSSKTELIKKFIVLNQAKLDGTLMIGDRKHDIIGAYNNNIDSVAVTYGFGSIEELNEYNPTVIVKTVQELKETLVN
jgi:phosphoglycolate phosphatase